MIELCNADYIKFQLYDVKELSYDWANDYDYYKACQLDDSTVNRILYSCENRNLKTLWTVFSHSQLERALRLGITNIKIASPNSGLNVLCDLAYVEAKTLVISTGMSTGAEISMMLREYPKATFLKCISRYPAVWTEKDKEEALRLNGISDHSKSIDTALWAVGNGLWVERHYTLGKDLPGKDHGISSLPEEFDAIVRERDYLKKVERFKTRWTS